ncbi:protein of unknown function (plasmid) [Magnetospirillum sp. XM-1]|uniref:hypothetical protein n=1 Tax=Magnetospirillum sp. XM-1 TaxID=1663591 RepID=UPI00073DC423|nr:hypothetical protein [Magnetospirillum sp. XM-1]CUW41903.1 protein of unknown function [Magnetospirillum sp. XM-1]
MATTRLRTLEPHVLAPIASREISLSALDRRRATAFRVPLPAATGRALRRGDIDEALDLAKDLVSEPWLERGYWRCEEKQEELGWVVETISASSATAREVVGMKRALHAAKMLIGEAGIPAFLFVAERMRDRSDLTSIPSVRLSTALRKLGWNIAA